MNKDLTNSLFAIYKNSLHLGNLKAINKNAAIRVYLLDSGYSKKDFSNIQLMNRYDAIIAIKDIHYL